MDYILLDTCIVLHLLRNKDIGERAKQAIHDFSEAPAIVLSVVTKGELEALSVQQNWGEARKKKLNAFLEDTTFIDLSHTDEALIEAYARSDGYSKQKATDKQGNYLSGAHRTMHKNDLWIAATSFILEIPLLTSDGDFDHLNGTLLNVMKVV